MTQLILFVSVMTAIMVFCLVHIDPPDDDFPNTGAWT